jgi:shikimate dehydrogenase
MVAATIDSQFIAAFEAEELGSFRPIHRPNSVVTATGSLAPDQLRKPFWALLQASADAPLTYYPSRGPLESLQANDDWAMCIVLSPHKATAAAICDRLSPMASRASAADTLLRDEQRRIAGLNTNVYAACATLRAVAASARPRRCLIVGTGATARCLVLALQSPGFSAQEIAVWGRNAERAKELAARYGVRRAAALAEGHWDMIIHCTTVGESADSHDAPAALPLLAPTLRPGVLFWDLNTRTSRLQTLALQAGCRVLSGSVMQGYVDQLRAHLFASSAPEARPLDG